MDTWYWALEYVRVFFAYVMILFVWPSVVFRDYLRGRSRTVRFAFCVTVPVVLLNTVVLSLGVFHILYGWLIAVLFYGTLLLGLLRWHPVRREQIKKISRLFLGTYGIRLLPPKHDASTATRHYRAFWQRRCRAAAAGAVLKP